MKRPETPEAGLDIYTLSGKVRVGWVFFSYAKVAICILLISSHMHIWYTHTVQQSLYLAFKMGDASLHHAPTAVGWYPTYGPSAKPHTTVRRRQSLRMWNVRMRLGVEIVMPKARCCERRMSCRKRASFEPKEGESREQRYPGGVKCARPLGS